MAETKANKKKKSQKAAEVETPEVVETIEEIEALEDFKEYIVINDFKDLKDGGFIYLKDDPYPRPENSGVSEERIQELMSNQNKQGKPLIKEQD